MITAVTIEQLTTIVLKDIMITDFQITFFDGSSVEYDLTAFDSLSVERDITVNPVRY